MKKVLIIIISVSLLLGLCTPAYSEEPETFNYVALGASNTNGYGLHGYTEEFFYDHPDELTSSDFRSSGYLYVPEECYPNQILNALKERGYNAKLSQMAQSSARAEELLFLLDESFTADEYTKWRFYNPDNKNYPGWWASDLDGLRSAYKEAITNADLITYDLGINNFGVYLGLQLTHKDLGNDLSRIIGEEDAERFYKFRSQIKEATSSFIDPDLGDTIDNALDTMAYALLGYIKTFDATMKIIRSLNPKADIVVLSIQNVLAGANVSLKGITVPLGDMIGALSRIANTYMATLSPYLNEYYYANVSNDGRVTYFIDELLDYNGDPTTISRNMLDCFNGYDEYFRVKQRVSKAMNKAIKEGTVTFENEEEREDFENQVLLTCYDTLASVLKKIASYDGLPIDEILGGADVDKPADAIRKGFCNLIDSAAKNKIDTLSGASSALFDIDKASDEWLSTDTMKLVGVYLVRTEFGNCFFAHPNPEGCKEIAAIVLNALDKRIGGRSAMIGAIRYANIKTIKNLLKSSIKRTYSFVNKIKLFFSK